MIFDIITNKFRLKFKDRNAAGDVLGDALKSVIKRDERKDTLVLGIPRGGIIVAEAITRKLACDFNIIFSRRLRATHNEELAIGAVTEDGTCYLNKPIIKGLKISHEYIQREVSYQLGKIKDLTTIYFPENTSSEKKVFDFSNRTIVVVDDGAATGATILAACRSLKKNDNLKRLIVAVPVAPKGTVDLLKNDCIDKVEVVVIPPNANFISVEQYYHNFKQVCNDHILEILRRLRT